tara:strand:+ start:684 stop:1214 length:531 start_codon:yes stop_codon:yes gene_type:complete
MNFIKKTVKFSLILSAFLYLNSCGIYRPTDAKEFPPEPEKRVQKNLDEGRGFRLFKNDKKNSGTFDFATSNELWRASLDTLDFMPLLSADYGGGILITDWYNENNNYEDYIKISIRFLTNEIRSDSLNVKVYSKKCENLNKCTINENNPEIEKKLISTILAKASKYKQAKESKKDE